MLLWPHRHGLRPGSRRLFRAPALIAALIEALIGTLIGATLAACGPEPAAERGQALASDPRLSPSPSNVFSCTTCHSTAAEPQSETRLLPGAPLRGALSRPSFWGGGLHYILDAVNQCLVDFMRGTALPPDDANGRALLAYLRTLDAPTAASASGPAAAQPCTVVRNIDSTYLAQLPAGDAGRGEGSYMQACAYCHGSPHTGQGRIGPYVSILPDDTVSAFGAAAAAPILIEKARHGRYFGISGAMPFYCTEVLGDAALSDIVAYLLK